MEKLGHRPKGSGGTMVRIAPRTDQGGARLFIGRALWQAIGSPARVHIRGTERGELLIIRAGKDHAVAGSASNGQPRVALSATKCAAFGIDAEHDVTYAAQATSGTIDVHLKHAPHGQMAGPEFKALRNSLGLSQTALGASIGVHYRTIQRWEQHGTGMTMVHYQALESVRRGELSANRRRPSAVAAATLPAYGAE